MIKKISLKKKVITLLVSFLAILSFSNIAAAYNFGGDSDTSGINTLATGAGYNLTSTTPEEYIGKILLLVFSFIGLIFMVLVIYAGIQWMTAQGNTSQVSKAKDTLVKAIVGLVIIMAAYGITFLIVNTFQSPANPNTAPSEQFTD
jgi:amino acid transporter